MSNSIYVIRVKGHLREDWSGRLGGLCITHEEDVHGSPLTLLTGPLADQSALHGVLAHLHALNLELLFVARVGAECSRHHGTSEDAAGDRRSETVPQNRRRAS